MKKYHKIETLFTFNQQTKGFNYGEFYNEDVEYLKDCQWVFTEKVDGTNFRLYWDGYNLSYAGRTDKAEFSKDQKEYINNAINTPAIEQLIEHTFGEKETYIFGELFGKNIQRSGKLYNVDYQFKVFDIMVGDMYLKYENVVDVCYKLGFDYVPIVIEGTIQAGIDYVENEELSTFSDAPLEGLVGFPKVGLFDRAGKRIIVKIKKRDLKNKGE